MCKSFAVAPLSVLFCCLVAGATPDASNGLTDSRRQADSGVAEHDADRSAPVLLRGSPAQVGLSSGRLARLDAVLQAEVDAGRTAGVAVIVARKGKIAYERYLGSADVSTGSPLHAESSFRMYSMTKPVISVALLMLYEEGRFQLTDPLAKHIPRMADVLVYVGEEPNGDFRLEPPRRPVTIQDVFRHTAGFGFGRPVGGLPEHPVDRAYQSAGIDPGTIGSLRELAEDKLPTVPLRHHPGDDWVYGVAHDVQAYLVEHYSGMPLESFLRQRLFEPLGMTGSFYGEADSGGPTWTTPYTRTEDGRLAPADDHLSVPYARFGEQPMGGTGLSMTLRDYARFSQMLLNGGELDGVRILGRKTVELMTTNHLREGERIDFFPGFGFGLGVAVLVSPVEAGQLGSAGQFGWAGAATTWVMIDPQEELVAILYAQHLPFDGSLVDRFRTLVYQSIVEE